MGQELKPLFAIKVQRQISTGEESEKEACQLRESTHLGHEPELFYLGFLVLLHNNGEALCVIET